MIQMKVSDVVFISGPISHNIYVIILLKQVMMKKNIDSTQENVEKETNFTHMIKTILLCF